MASIFVLIFFIIIISLTVLVADFFDRNYASKIIKKRMKNMLKGALKEEEE